jgi:DEAD/DEAH box helicase
MSGPPVQSHGFQTSVDMAHQQTTSIAAASRARAGVKRPRAATDDAAFLRDIQASDFVRASSSTRSQAASAGARIAASPIRHATGHASNIIRAIPPPLAPPPATTNANPLLSLHHPRYGLPPALVANFCAVGIHSIYPWQASCLLGRGHLTAEKNLLYTAPTGGGKSLVADVLMLKRVIENPHRKAILVLPYVALVQEKLKWLRCIVQDVEKNVGDLPPDPAKQQPWRQPSKEISVTGFFGGSKSRATWADTDIAVCTIEKVGSVNRLRIYLCLYTYIYISLCSCVSLLIRWCRQTLWSIRPSRNVISMI